MRQHAQDVWDIGEGAIKTRAFAKKICGKGADDSRIDNQAAKVVDCWQVAPFRRIFHECPHVREDVREMGHYLLFRPICARDGAILAGV